MPKKVKESWEDRFIPPSDDEPLESNNYYEHLDLVREGFVSGHAVEDMDVADISATMELLDVNNDTVSPAVRFMHWLTVLTARQQQQSRGGL